MDDLSNPQDKNVKPVSPIPPEIIEKMLQNQAEEIRIRGEEIEIQRDNSKNNYEYSVKALELQAEEFKDQRKYRKSTEAKALGLFIFLVLVIAIVIILSMIWDKEEIAIELIKAIIFLFAGGSIGFGIGRARKDKNINESN